MGYRYLKIKVYTKIILLWQFQNICIPKNGETQNNIALIFKNNHSKIKSFGALSNEYIYKIDFPFKTKEGVFRL